jgi:hypothetical protein
MILQALKKSSKGIISALALGAWSDGAMVMDNLKVGECENQKVTIFIILRYMWAWEWYNRQVKQLETIGYIKRNHPLRCRSTIMQDVRPTIKY